jgi:ribosomal protein S6
MGLMSLLKMKPEKIYFDIKNFINTEQFKKEYSEVNKLINDKIINEIEKPSNFEKRNELFPIDKKNKGYYLHSIKLILYYLKNFNFLSVDKLNPTIFRFIINDICNYGGDTDIC